MLLPFLSFFLSFFVFVFEALIQLSSNFHLPLLYFLAMNYTILKVSYLGAISLLGCVWLTSILTLNF